MTRSRDLANLADGTEFTAADHTKLDGIETSATADQTGAQIKTAYEAESDTNAFTDADHSKLDGVAASANNYVHPNHSGEVTSTADGATVIADNIVDEANLKVSNAPTNGYFLSAQSGNTGGMTWAEVAQPTAAETLTTIKTVDGTGSGLDADLLDGQHGAYYAPIGSPTLTGTPAAPTASAGANSTQISTTAYVDAAISALADSAPAALNTLNELAAALGDDANYAATTTTAIGTKLAKAGGQMTGNITMAGSQTVDGRDLSVDGTKLDTIETSANVTDTANVVAALTAGTNVAIAANGTISSTDTNTTYSVGDGGLSEINFTSADHTKLNGIATGANNFSMPSALVPATIKFNNAGPKLDEERDQNMRITGHSGTDIGITGNDSSNNFRFQLYASPNNYGFLNGTWNAWDLQKTLGGNLYMNNNTGYYLNTSSTSNLNALNVAGSAAIAGNISINGWGFRNSGSNASYNADTIDNNGVTYYNSGVTNFSGNSTDGALYSQRYSTSWQHQIAGDYRSGQIAVRGRNNGTWQSWYKVWSENNDGSGSGLDADTVDGIQAANFLRSDTADTIDNSVVITQRGSFTTGTSGQNNSHGGDYNYGYQQPGGWSSPFPDLVVGYHTGMRLGGYYGYGGTRFYNDHPYRTTTILFSVGNGDSHVRATNNIYAYTSDIRLKENFRPIENAVDKVKAIGGFIFDWRKDMMEKHEFTPDQQQDDAGLIAQEVQKVMPAAIKRAPFDHDLTKPNQSKSGEEFLTVQYEKMVPLLVEAIKEQQKQIDELKKLLENK